MLPPVTDPDFDLQAHSTCSDGSLPPEEVVARAGAAGVRLLALTDHDATDGVDAALAAGRRAGVRIVPAAELSALDGDREDLHVCAYGIDHRAPAWADAVRAFREDRNARGGRMLDALRAEGFALDTTTIDARAAAGEPVGRPHLAAAVRAHPENAARLAAEGLATPGDVLEAYLLPGRPAYRRRTLPTVAQAVELIHAHGGVAIWAHPYWDIPDDTGVADTVDRFAALGIDGVECYYVTFDARQTRLLDGICRERGLLRTGSSDFHGPEHERFHRFRAFSLHGCEPDLGPIPDMAR